MLIASLIRYPYRWVGRLMTSDGMLIASLIRYPYRWVGRRRRGSARAL
jgi:hypothetical protein